MAIANISEHAKRTMDEIRKAADHLHPHGTNVEEIEAAQRYRTMIGIEQPFEERTARARKNAKHVTPLSSKTW